MQTKPAIALLPLLGLSHTAAKLSPTPHRLSSRWQLPPLGGVAFHQGVSPEQSTSFHPDKTADRASHFNGNALQYLREYHHHGRLVMRDLVQKTHRVQNALLMLERFILAILLTLSLHLFMEIGLAPASQSSAEFSHTSQSIIINQYRQ